MRTANICPTCATFENALCVLYNGAYLTNTKISPLDSLETALIKINANLVPLTGIVAPTANATYLGQQYLNTVTKQLYYAKAINTGASDWTLSVNGTAGQVGFYSSQYNLIGDNGLFWDNTNKRLGIGTITPLYKFDVVGDSRLTGSLYVTGTFRDSTNSVGTAGQVLSSTVTGTDWVSLPATPGLQAVLNAGNTATQSIILYGGINTSGDGTFNEVRIGKGVGQINSNTVVGQYALSTNTSGYQNTVLGFTAMQLNGSGYQNTAIGSYALAANTSGSGNTAVGDYALTLNGTGIDNVAIGKDALRAATAAIRCVAIGEEAMYSATTAVQNVSVGYKSLFAGGSYNVSVGYQSGNGGQASTSVGFESLHDNTGLYNTAVGYRSLYVNSTGQFNTALGYRALQANQTGLRNTSLGGQSLYNATGSYNIGIGYDAGRYVTIDGGAANTGSTSCIYIGYKSLAATATDTNAIVIGNGGLSLGSNTTVIGNGSTTKTAIYGNLLLGNTLSVTSNTAKLEVTGNAYFESGEDSHAFVVYGGANADTAIRFNGDERYLALQENYGPVVIGQSSSIDASKLQVTGDSTFIKAGGATINIKDSDFVDYYSQLDNQGFYITDANIGINTNYNVNGVDIQNNDAGYNSNLSDNQLYVRDIETNASVTYRWDGITMLTWDGDEENLYTSFIVNNLGSVYNATSIYGTISDRRLKENITPATSKLDDLLKVNIVNYNLIKDNTKQIGVIAQEIEEVFPGLVSENEEGFKSVKTSVFIPMLIKGMQEQQDIIKNLQTQIDELKSKIQ